GGAEEQAIIEAQRRVHAAHPGALLVIAPRHPQRFAEVAGTLARAGMRYARRSEAPAAAPDCEVLLLDTLGELLDFYAAADLAFVGGSLAPVGGHNLLEPAALGLPILTGPYNTNSEEIAQLLIARGAAEVVRDAAGLRARVSALLADPAARARMGAAGRACVDSNRGALDKLLDRKSTRLNPSHSQISYAVFCLKKKKKTHCKAAPKFHYFWLSFTCLRDASVAPPPPPMICAARPVRPVFETSNALLQAMPCSPH